MNTVVQKIKKDRLNGIWNLFIRSLPYHFLVLTIYLGLRYATTQLPFPETLKHELGLALAGFVRSSLSLSLKIGLIITAVLLLQIAFYTFFITIYYRVNEMIAKNLRFNFHFVFDSFLKRFSKGFAYNTIIVAVYGALFYLTFLFAKHSSINIGFKAVAYFFAVLILISGMIMLYIRQLLILPNIVHNNTSIVSSIVHSFKTIKSKHAILSFFLSIAIGFIFFVILAILAGALVRMEMPNFQLLLANPWYKFIPLYIVYVIFYILYYVTRSAMLLYSTNQESEEQWEEDNSGILDHISDEE